MNILSSVLFPLPNLVQEIYHYKDTVWFEMQHCLPPYKDGMESGLLGVIVQA